MFRATAMIGIRSLTGLLGVACACVVVGLSLTLVACPSSDDQDGNGEPPSWNVVDTSEAEDFQVLVHNRTGIQYVVILRDESGARVHGLCERYGTDGRIMHDGDATKGGAFGLQVVTASDDVIVYRDKQTGIAYEWHRWHGDDLLGRQGLVVCRDANGNVLRWDDDEFFPVIPSDAHGVYGTNKA
jgi:hypothetical protein